MRGKRILKVLHINCNYIGTTLHQLMIEELTRQGIENEVFVPTYSKEIAVINPNTNVTVSECFLKRDRIIFDYKQYKIIKDIEKYYDIASFDLIHAYTLFTDGNVARVLSQKYGIPYIVAVRNTDVNDFFKKLIFLRPRGVKILLHSNTVFFLSSTYKNTVHKKYIPEKYQEIIATKEEIIPNGIDKFWLKNLYRQRNYAEILKRISEKELRLIYVGDIDKNKNIILTCKAIDILKKNGWSIAFTVIGKIKDTKVFNTIKDHIFYVSPRPKEKLLEYYRMADVFVMPSVSESFGLVYAEAMSQGLPVIYTKGQGFDAQFEEGTVGFHVSSDNDKELVKKIKLITKDYKNISKRTLIYAKKFSWETICERYVNIYKSISLED